MINTKIEALISLKPATEWTWLGDKYEDLNWLDSSTKPTEAELDAEVTRLNNLEPMKLLREERDKRLSDCDWRASSDLIISDAWKTYRQLLRDLPANTTPTCDSNGNLDSSSVTWPTEPS